VHNFFAATGAAAAHLIECRLTMTRVLCFVSRACASNVARRAKTTISSAFLRFTQTFQNFSERENACAPRRAWIRRSPIDIAEGGGTYTQN
jgi:hypothetical protein